MDFPRTPRVQVGVSQVTTQCVKAALFWLTQMGLTPRKVCSDAITLEVLPWPEVTPLIQSSGLSHDQSKVSSHKKITQILRRG